MFEDGRGSTVNGLHRISKTINDDEHRTAHYLMSTSCLLSIDYAALCAVICIDYEGPLARTPLARSLSVEEIVTYLFNTR